MKSFKDYTPNQTTQNPQEKQGVHQAKNQETVGIEELTKQIASAYEGKSSLEMMRNILAQAENAKRAGTLTNDDIDAFYAQFSPMLNGFQRKKLQEIAQKLKNI
ncbi:MAG: hypothetical protein IJW58_00695 [Clostridia bacterium]|nr:hypothetical protein [Clostridia bacterium]